MLYGYAYLDAVRVRLTYTYSVCVRVYNVYVYGLSPVEPNLFHQAKIADTTTGRILQQIFVSFLPLFLPALMIR